MYTQMDRSAVKALRKRGKSYRAIAAQMGCDRKTVKRVLETPVDHKCARKSTGSQVDAYSESILQWLEEEVPVKRMLEMATEAPEPYLGRRAAFYAAVARIRKVWELDRAERFVRFEGLPGEYCQIDWGEMRQFPFLREDGATRYFFAARLKYSRVSYVEFTMNMRLETLIRCMLQAFVAFGGVSWICVFDNMKTVVLRRDNQKRPVWNPTFLKFMKEVDSHPEACWPNSGNQKGSVENLVGWVKSNFLKGRSFLDDADLAVQCRDWLDQANGSVSQAHGAIPREVLQREQAKLCPLTTNSDEYGIFHTVEAGPEMLVHIDGNRYMVPVGCVGIPLVGRIRRWRIDIYNGERLVATHQRRLRKEFKPILNPEYCESVLEEKPRARVMLYRDHLMEQDASIASFVAELCRRQRGTAAFSPHILKMYDLWRTHGTEELGVACAIASEHCAYGVEYLVSLLRTPQLQAVEASLTLQGIPEQDLVDRPLAHYEAYVTGGDSYGA